MAPGAAGMFRRGWRIGLRFGAKSLVLVQHILYWAGLRNLSLTLLHLSGWAAWNHHFILFTIPFFSRYDVSCSSIEIVAHLGGTC